MAETRGISAPKGEDGNKRVVMYGDVETIRVRELIRGDGSKELVVVHPYPNKSKEESTKKP